eukprot:GILK01001604.1.p1 GENE.GILK01001604.1~~GILK01001604.1.p1  ORF type:complete len:441 (-),score=90.83 GILK01001604.1:130-1401(-)
MATMSMAPFEQAIDELDTSALSILRFKENAATSFQKEAQLASVKELFGQLKVTFIEQESKKSFIEGLLAATDLSHLNLGDIADSTEIEQSTRALKEHNAALEKDILAVARDIEAKYGQFEASRSDFMHKIVDAKEWFGDMQAKSSRGTDDHMSVSYPTNMDTEQKCQTILDDQMAVMQSLNAQSQALQEDVEDLQTKQEQLLRTISTVREQMGGLHSIGSDRTDATDEGLQWYQSMLQIVKTLGGAQLVDSTENQISIELRPIESRADTYILTSQFHPGTTQLQTFTVSPSEVDIDDIVAFAVETNDMSLLVRETKARLANHIARVAELSTLSEQMPVTWTANPLETVCVTVESVVVCVFHIDQDYPLPYSPARLGSFTLLKESIKPHMEQLMAHINREESMTISAAVSLTRQRIQELALSGQ